MFAKKVKNLGLCLIILPDVVLICFTTTPVLAGTDDIDIVRKQKEKERQEVKEKNESQKKDKAVYDRSLELFDIVVSALEELRKKGMKFESIEERLGDSIEVIKGRKMYVTRDYDGSVWGYSPIVATEFNDKVILYGSFLYTIKFKPQHGKIIIIEVSTSGDDKHLSVKIDWKPMVLTPLYDSNALKNKRNEIQKKLLEQIEAVLK